MDVGRTNKMLNLLNYIDDEDYRRRILTQLNRGESRHAVTRAICYGQRGEIRNVTVRGGRTGTGHYRTRFICRKH